MFFNKMNFFYYYQYYVGEKYFRSFPYYFKRILGVDRSVKEYRQVLDIDFKYLTKGGFSISVC